MPTVQALSVGCRPISRSGSSYRLATTFCNALGFNITCSTMNRRRLEAIRRLLDQARCSQQKARDLERLARMLGRRQDRRGKEPTWVHDELPVYPALDPSPRRPRSGAGYKK